MPERFKSTTEQIHDTEQPPFLPKLFSWKQEDYEQRLREMADLPCVRDPELVARMSIARNNLDTYYEAKHPHLWHKSHKTFSPRQVMIRYDGQGWDYTFHSQQRTEFPENTGSLVTKRVENEQESNIVGIAKKMVRVTTKLVREAREKMEQSDPAEQKRIGTELVQQAEDIFSSVFPNKNSYGGVTVDELQGPRGPVYQTTTDGNHRIAAARLIDLKRVRGEVNAIENPEIAQTYWFDLLAQLSESEREELQTVYDELYPNMTEEERVAERNMLERAIERRPKIDEDVLRLNEERNREYEIRQLAYDLEREQVQSRVHTERPLHESLMNDPIYRKVLAETGFDYLMNHSDDYVRKSGAARVDERGAIYDAQDQFIGNVLGIDLYENGAYPKRADGEIISLALQKYRQLTDKKSL